MSHELESEIKKLLIEALSLEDVQEEDIDPEAPIFGDGLGLDSIDALELGIALQKKYGIRLEGKSDDTREYFSSVRKLAELVAQRRNESS